MLFLKHLDLRKKGNIYEKLFLDQIESERKR